MKGRFHRLAEKEFRLSVQWYLKRSKSTAIAFVNQVLALAESCAENPLGFAAYDDAHRWAKVPGFPFVLYFRNPNRGQVDIVAVAHAHRRPGYWKRRKGI